MGERVTIFVTGKFSASHVCAEGVPHEHKDWEVRAYFSVAPHSDARCHLAALDALLASWDGKLLPAGRDWSEDVAAMVGTLCNCIGVEIYRPGERIGARWPS